MQTSDVWYQHRQNQAVFQSTSNTTGPSKLNQNAFAHPVYPGGSVNYTSAPGSSYQNTFSQGLHQHQHSNVQMRNVSVEPSAEMANRMQFLQERVSINPGLQTSRQPTDHFRMSAQSAKSYNTARYGSRQHYQPNSASARNQSLPAAQYMQKQSTAVLQAAKDHVSHSSSSTGQANYNRNNPSALLQPSSKHVGSNSNYSIIFLPVQNAQGQHLNHANQQPTLATQTMTGNVFHNFTWTPNGNLSCNVSDTSRVMPPNVSDTHRVMPPNVSDTSRVMPPNVSDTSRVMPPNVSDTSRVMPPNVSDASRVMPPNVSDTSRVMPHGQLQKQQYYCYVNMPPQGGNTVPQNSVQTGQQNYSANQNYSQRTMNVGFSNLLAVNANPASDFSLSRGQNSYYSDQRPPEPMNVFSQALRQYKNSPTSPGTCSTVLASNQVPSHPYYASHQPSLGEGSRIGNGSVDIQGTGVTQLANGASGPSGNFDSGRSQMPVFVNANHNRNESFAKDANYVHPSFVQNRTMQHQYCLPQAQTSVTSPANPVVPTSVSNTRMCSSLSPVVQKKPPPYPKGPEHAYFVTVKKDAHGDGFTPHNVILIGKQSSDVNAAPQNSTAPLQLRQQSPQMVSQSSTSNHFGSGNSAKPFGQHANETQCGNPYLPAYLQAKNLSEEAKRSVNVQLQKALSQQKRFPPKEHSVAECNTVSAALSCPKQLVSEDIDHTLMQGMRNDVAEVLCSILSKCKGNQKEASLTPDLNEGQAALNTSVNQESDHIEESASENLEFNRSLIAKLLRASSSGPRTSELQIAIVPPISQPSSSTMDNKEAFLNTDSDLPFKIMNVWSLAEDNDKLEGKTSSGNDTDCIVKEVETSGLSLADTNSEKKDVLEVLSDPPKSPRLQNVDAPERQNSVMAESNFKITDVKSLSDCFSAEGLLPSPETRVIPQTDKSPDAEPLAEPQKKDAEENSDLVLISKKNLYDLSTIPVNEWTLKKLVKLVGFLSDCVIPYDINNSLTEEIINQYWDGEKEKFLQCFNNPYENLLSWFTFWSTGAAVNKHSVIFTEMKAGCFEKIKENCQIIDSQTTQPTQLDYKSSWLNLNEQLDDIDKESAFPESLHIGKPTSEMEKTTCATETKDDTADVGKTHNLEVLPSVSSTDTFNVTTSPKATDVTATTSSDPLCNAQINVLVPADANEFFCEFQNEGSKEETLNCVSPVEETLKCVSPVEETLKCSSPVEETLICVSPVEETLKCASPVEETLKCVSPVEKNDENENNPPLYCCISRWIEDLNGNGGSSSCLCQSRTKLEKVTDQLIEEKPSEMSNGKMPAEYLSDQQLQEEDLFETLFPLDLSTVSRSTTEVKSIDLHSAGEKPWKDNDLNCQIRTSNSPTPVTENDSKAVDDEPESRAQRMNISIDAIQVLHKKCSQMQLPFRKSEDHMQGLHGKRKRESENNDQDQSHSGISPAPNKPSLSPKEYEEKRKPHVQSVELQHKCSKGDGSGDIKQKFKKRKREKGHEYPRPKSREKRDAAKNKTLSEAKSTESNRDSNKTVSLVLYGSTAPNRTPLGSKMGLKGSDKSQSLASKSRPFGEKITPPSVIKLVVQSLKQDCTVNAEKDAESQSQSAASRTKKRRHLEINRDCNSLEKTSGWKRSDKSELHKAKRGEERKRRKAKLLDYRSPEMQRNPGQRKVVSPVKIKKRYELQERKKTDHFPKPVPAANEERPTACKMSDNLPKLDWRRPASQHEQKEMAYRKLKRKDRLKNHSSSVVAPLVIVRNPKPVFIVPEAQVKSHDETEMPTLTPPVEENKVLHFNLLPDDNHFGFNDTDFKKETKKSSSSEKKSSSRKAASEADVPKKQHWKIQGYWSKSAEASTPVQEQSSPQLDTPPPTPTSATSNATFQVFKKKFLEKEINIANK